MAHYIWDDSMSFYLSDALFLERDREREREKDLEPLASRIGEMYICLGEHG